MEIEMELPLDTDGFLRRECPYCELEFKWHHGKTESAPATFVYPSVYWCPRCGRSAGHDAWWTKDQLRYQQEVVGGVAGDVIGEALMEAFGTRRNSPIGFEVQQGGRPEVPDPLFEPDDMMMIAPPCHSWEPVKVPEDSVAPYFCLVCGAAYAV
jgi:hypothetical protein